MPAILQKQNDNTKYNRLNQIYEILKNNSYGMNITELSKEFEVSTKTIQRDLVELQKYGAIRVGRTWKIDPKLKEDNLSSNEKMVLGILDEMAKGAGKIFYSKAHSLLSQVSQQLEHPIFANINSEYLEEKNILLFNEIESVIKEKVEIIFDYENHKFHVKPLKLAFFDGFWYMLVLHIKGEKEEFKKFHLKTIKNIQLLENKFEIPQIVEDRLNHANSVWFNLDEQFIVRLYIDKIIRKYFERKPLRGQRIIGEDKDGSIEIEIIASHEMEIIPLVYWYIPYIKVLEPQWLADSVKGRAIKYLEGI